jgi:hypothetical protein
MRIKYKVETAEEFLARGGTIKKVDPGASGIQHNVTRKRANGEPAVILSYEEAEVYYGDGKVKTKKKAKQKASVDMSFLPESLKQKFLARITEGDFDVEEDN